MRQWILTFLWVALIATLVIALDEWALGVITLIGLGFLVVYASTAK